MKLKYAILLLTLVAFFNGRSQQVIPIETKDFSMVFKTDQNKRLWNVYFGKKLSNLSDYNQIADQYEFPNSNAGIYNAAYTPSGTWSLSEPAIQVTHADGNQATDLIFEEVITTEVDEASLTKIKLVDPIYNLNIILNFKVWKDLNVIEQWTQINNNEDGSIDLKKYASANLYFTNKDFFLTHYQGEYLRELQPVEEKLSQGTKVIESKLGTRAMLLGSPNFMLSFETPSQEDSGLVVLGQLAWSGNYKLEFDIDSHQNLRLLAGINPYESTYTLNKGESFKTPSLIYTVSDKGAGNASRQIHSWAKNYRVLDGNGDRLTLLNNWEATYFDFNESKLSKLIENTSHLGLDLFLLDDGWFGNNHPRNNDDAGLGDWKENKKKLPNGLRYLVKQAKKNDIKFGIWIEPEMVNPESDLFKTHPEWVIKQPERPAKLYRNQMVLDLTNPEVQDFVYGIVDHLFTENPEIAFIKWDCNAVIYNAYSNYLNENKVSQNHLYIDYVHGLYDVLKRIREKYPKVPMMLCSGGGGRADYGFLKYFTEFWPSDNTEPIERIFLQWNYSFFFPAVTMDCHVTHWGKQPLKFKVDVASMGKLGFDIDLSHMSQEDIQFAKQSIQNYNGFKNVVLHGEQYRLASPYKNPFASLMYVNNDKSQAIMFNFLSSNRFMEIMTKRPIKLKGLNPDKHYKVKEINLYNNTKTTINESAVYSGDFLMTVGINPNITGNRTSVILKFEEVN
ncbi:alpha-galactosidase [Aestuariibaculum sp. YM273]|uniref:alpha-galactosidase n=1 Tax=Aestuariibaculum sp. YM273 TaxID=3070659 RepID=UPI0027DBD657|nr:alpha-galactosidase [Aestuariibaculum sp. YM273]WMI64800.1 alpha-galactosidase [Aestuariibaculum sp. YM273]